MAKRPKVISTDGNFFDDMLAKERKILEEFHTPEEIAEIYKEHDTEFEADADKEE
jgi:hypothetical protein|nr:MAG TPA: Protein of unknown function (DUF1700) [Caudoviricetes sp.]